VINPLDAMKAYGAVQKAMGAGDQMPGMGGASPVGGFGDILRATMGDAVQASRHAESQMAAQVAGKTELVDVVTAISAAEASLETVLAVRDQVITAYQEIMRMPI
jgi:flagellar hook-basal body complex protein FliE